ncbi:MAG TPA: hypothetical protein VNU68_29625 [Verrucomicrobiae bacterium]|nr:hypothetical protein [Verrucomicrobiae bacterium]
MSEAATHDAIEAVARDFVRTTGRLHRDAGIPFRVPDLPELSERLSFVLDAIYAAYTTGWDCLHALDALPQGSLVNYQPFWAARGHLMELLNRKAEADQAFTRAASLTDDPALRDYLLRRIEKRPEREQAATHQTLRSE